MEPIHREKRRAYQNGPEVPVASVKNLDSEAEQYSLFSEGGDLGFLDDGETPLVKENSMTTEEIKIQALTQAITMARLMTDVTLDSVFVIAAKIATYLAKDIPNSSEER